MRPVTLRRWASLAFAAALASHCATALAQAPGSADALLKGIVEATVAGLKAERERSGGAPAMQAALAITRRVIVPHVDFERITRDAVGKPWAAASPAQRATVTAEFRTLLTHVVARLLATYEDEDFSIAPADSAKDPVVLRINVRQTRSPGETPMQPMFVSLHRAAGAWRIHELRAENVNLVRLYSANFAVVMEREGGIDGLAKALAERNARNVAPDTAASAPAAGAAPKPGPKPAPQRAPALPSAPWEASSVSP